YFFFQAEDGIRDFHVTGVQTCALPISRDYRAHRCHVYSITRRGRPRRKPSVLPHVLLSISRVHASTCSPSLRLLQTRPIRRPERSEERRVGKECRSRRRAYH